MYNKEKLARGLTLAADILAQEIRSLAKDQHYPKEVVPSIQVGTAEVTETAGRIAITSDGSRDEYGYTPYDMIVVYELGTGVHGATGKKYPIKPRKDGGLLVFEWLNRAPYDSSEDSTNKANIRNGMAYLPSVMHPGVKAKPILDTAIKNKQAQMLEIIGQNLEFKIFDGPRVEIIR